MTEIIATNSKEKYDMFQRLKSEAPEVLEMLTKVAGVFGKLDKVKVQYNGNK